MVGLQQSAPAIESIFGMPIKVAKHCAPPNDCLTLASFIAIAKTAIGC
jgi:hypothetical protein